MMTLPRLIIPFLFLLSLLSACADALDDEGATGVVFLGDEGREQSEVGERLEDEGELGRSGQESNGNSGELDDESDDAGLDNFENDAGQAVNPASMDLGQPEDNLAMDASLPAIDSAMLANGQNRCGDGLVQIGEVCDDGNRGDGDGCASNCQEVEPGFVCPNARGVGGACRVENPGNEIDTLEWVVPCTVAGCSVAHRGGDQNSHNLHFYLSEINNAANTGVAYHVKGMDQRCWEQLSWDADFISIPFDNCWLYQSYRYTIYADGRWLKRRWSPGESFDADQRVFAGTWEECLDEPMPGPRVRTMTFLWRDQNYNWGGIAGVRDTIAIQQSYRDAPHVLEIYYYARGWGLVRWEMRDTERQEGNHLVNFNLNSAETPRPCRTECRAATNGVVPCPCARSCDRSKICGVSPDGCGGTCQAGSGCQNGLAAGQSLLRGADCITSVGGRARLCHQVDGNVVVYDRANRPIFNTMTGGRATTDFSMQADGNLVLYHAGRPLWHSVSGGRQQDDYVAVIQDDCNLVIYDSDGDHVWNSGRLCQ